MRLEIKKGVAKGCVLAPPSKSVAHRYLFCSLLANGESEIKNISYSSDILASLNAIKSIGCSVIENDYSVKVYGLGDNEYLNDTIIDCNESGSTIRFLIPILLTTGKEFTLTGTEKLLSRPMIEYEQLCQKKGFKFEKANEHITLKGNLTFGEYTISSEVSSQFATGMLLALSRFSEESKINFVGKINSKPYIDMTMDALSEFGRDCLWIDDNTIIIYSGRVKPNNVFIEGDESNAAFLHALNYLGGNVCVNGLNANTKQGDSIFKDYFDLLEKENCTLDIDNVPDLAPILMAMASVKHGCTLINTSRLKVKESDRGVCMMEELSKFGIKVDVFDNSIVVHNGKIKKPVENICSHNDHRIAMANSILLTQTGGIIDGCECVRKSFPDFYDVLKTLNIEIEEK